VTITESAWLTATNPVQLLPHLAARENLRKLRLFLCGCFRLREEPKWRAERYEFDRAATELAEAWADDLIEQNEVFASGVLRASNINLFPNEGQLRHIAAEAPLVKKDPPFTASLPEQALRARLLRDIFGNPFRPVAFAPEWRTDTVLALARQMYESRDFGAMPILADALQDAGCDSDDILSHCRDANQVHVRGCWVVDLVLGKA
jgi:hypothetical protein